MNADLVRTVQAEATDIEREIEELTADLRALRRLEARLTRKRDTPEPTPAPTVVTHGGADGTGDVVINGPSDVIEFAIGMSGGAPVTMATVKQRVRTLDSSLTDDQIRNAVAYLMRVKRAHAVGGKRGVYAPGP